MVLIAFHFSNQKAKVREMEHTVNVIPMHLVFPGLLARLSPHSHHLLLQLLKLRTNDGSLGFTQLEGGAPRRS